MTTSYLVPVPKAQFFDNNGYPLAGGLLYSYAAGTSTPLATYTDATGNTPNTNPVVLDASGRADIWLGPALYKLTLTTSAGSNIWTEDNIQGNGFFNGVLANYWAGLATGTVNAIILTTNPSVSSLIAPVQVSFIAAYTNTGAVTINLDSLGVKNLYKQTSAGVVALTGGELVAGNIYNISYDNTEWQLISGAGSAVYWGGTSGGAANVQTATSTPSFTAYNASIQFSFIAGFTNTGATTININGIGAKNIYKLSSTGPVALTGGELQTGSVYTIIYDGTEFQLQTNNIPAIQQSGYRQNLKGVWGSNTTTGWTANQLMVLNSSLQPTILSSYSQTLNSATSGAGGLDTGTLAASTWYYVYAIYNPTTPATSILMSASATTPTLPSGYTYSALIGVVLTDGSKNFIGFTQYDRDWFYKVGNNLSAYPTICSGAQGTPTTSPVYVAQSVVNFVPTPIASEIHILAFAFNNSVLVAPNNNFGGISSLTNCPPVSWNGGSAQLSFFIRMVLESTNIYYAASNSTPGVLCSGFTMNL